MPYEREECACVQCDDKQLIIDEAQDFLMPIVQQLYNKAAFDLEHFEFCLDNLCAQLGVKLPEGQLVVKQQTSTDRAIEAWKEWNNTYLKSLTYTQV